MLDLGRRIARLDPVIFDVVLVGVVLLIGMLGLAVQEPGVIGTSPLRWVLSLALALPLLARRRFAEAVLVAVAAAALLQALLVPPGPGFDGFLALLIAAFSAGAHARTWTGLAALAGALGAVIAVGLTMPPLTTEGVVIPFIYLGAAWGTGRLARSRGDRAERLAREAERLARERDERGRLAAAQERARIARELHDVVAHAVTTMVLQAGAAEAELAPDQARLRGRLSSIGASGRQALDELRRVLAVLRTSEASDEESGPVPGLADLPRLTDQLRTAGIEVDLTVDAGPGRLPPSLELSAYRIVQEALTNVLRHASATRTSVLVRREAKRLTVEVRDDGRGAGPGTAIDGGGHGLVGMRERAAMFGGALTAELSPDGGFVVRAQLPVPEERP
ncbi:MAG: sensor histidine kinase [Candidatus Limnocylindria bacterium]